MPVSPADKKGQRMCSVEIIRFQHSVEFMRVSLSLPYSVM